MTHADAEMGASTSSHLSVRHEHPEVLGDLAPASLNGAGVAITSRVRLVQRRTTMNKPSWWTDDRTNEWERAKEAVRRDWEQTRHDLHLGGHELNQDLHHTLAQAVGSESLPAIDVANPPQVIGTWQEAEVAIGFGYAARTYFGHQYPAWTSALGRTLEHDWKNQAMPWKTAEILVRHGYDVRH